LKNLLLALAMAGLFTGSPARAVPLVQNGDFSVDFASGPLPWITTGSVFWLSNQASIVNLGTLTQTGTTPLAVGDPYRLTFDVATGALNQENTLTVFYGATLLATLNNLQNNLSGVVVDFSPTTPLDFLRFSFTANNQSPLEDIGLDNIVLVNLNAPGAPEIDLNSVAVPTAVALILLAL